MAKYTAFTLKNAECDVYVVPIPYYDRNPDRTFGEYHYEGDTEEIAIDDPDTMILNGDSEQFILFNYFRDETHVWGYKFSSVDITVNGIVPQIKSYIFTCDGKEWSVDRWCLDIADENVEIDIQTTASSKEE